MSPQEIQQVARFVSPIYKRTNHSREAHPLGLPKPVGTGFLVLFNERPYLISAAHVFDEVQTEELFFGCGEAEVPISGTFSFDDKADVGVVKLQRESADVFPQLEQHAIPEGLLHAYAWPRAEKTYVAIGYPAGGVIHHRSSNELRVEPQAIEYESLPEERYGEFELKPNVTIAGEFDARRSGTKHPNGMSGSPILLTFGFIAERPFRSKSPIVDLLTDYREDCNLLIGSDIAAALRSISRLAAEDN